MIVFKGDYVRLKRAKEFLQAVYIYYGEGNNEFDTYLVLANGKIIGLPFADKIQEIKTCKQVTGYDFEEWQEINQDYFNKDDLMVKEQLPKNTNFAGEDWDKGRRFYY